MRPRIICSLHNLNERHMRFVRNFVCVKVSKKKCGRSPFENHMGKEPNIVKTNLVEKLTDISSTRPGPSVCTV